MLNSLRCKRRGVGGVFFLTCAILSILVMIVITDLSRVAAVTSVANNISHVATTKTAIFAYNNGLETSYFENTIMAQNGKKYSPLDDFNAMVGSYGFIKQGSKRATIEWSASNRVAKVDVGHFICKCNTSGILFGGNRTESNKLKPSIQTVKIEDK